MIKPIPNFPGYYARTDGAIISFKHITPRVLKPDRRPEDGRKRYTLMDSNGARVRKYGSYFVLITFHDTRPVGLEACHNDGNCLNDAPSNLRWDTMMANKADMEKHGTVGRGENHVQAKLTDAQATEIFERRQKGEPLKSLAEQFGITQAMVSFIAHGKRQNAN